MKKILLVDIDRTVAASHWRDKLMPNTKEEAGEWDRYHLASFDDKPIVEVIDLIRLMSLGGWYAIGLTARPGKWRDITMDWIRLHGVYIRELLMRADDDLRGSVAIKLALFAKRFPSQNGHSFLLLEDRPDVAEAFAKLHITVLQVVAGKCYYASPQ